MALAHRIGDLRNCGALTAISPGHQSFVTVDGKLWATQGALSTHGAGAFVTTNINWIQISGKSVVTVGDISQPDTLCYTAGGLHCAPVATTGSLINVGS